MFKSLLSKVLPAAASVASGGTLAPALIGGAASLAGGFLANKGRANQANISGQFNQASAREQMEFQERMSNTAHQRQIEDLKKAGLNPLLSAKYGGASSPGGSSATRPMADQKDIISPAISSALTIQQNEADIALKTAQAANQQAQADRLENIAPVTETLGDLAKDVRKGLEVIKSWTPEKAIDAALKAMSDKTTKPVKQALDDIITKGADYMEATADLSKSAQQQLDEIIVDATRPSLKRTSGKTRGIINRPKTTRKSTTYEKVWGMPNQIKSGSGRNNPRGRR